MKCLLAICVLLSGSLLFLTHCGSGVCVGTIGECPASSNPVTPLTKTTTNLAIAVSAPTVLVGGTVVFTATGGTPPYNFTLTSGVGQLNAATGAFLASAAGVSIARVTDTTATYKEISVLAQPRTTLE